MYHNAASPHESRHLRNSERRPFQKSLLCSFGPSDQQRRLATVVDLSHTGMGIVTDFAVSQGEMLWFNDGSGDKEGQIRWSVKVDSGYRAGISLASPLVHYERAEDQGFHVAEGTEKYYSLLNEATEEFISRLSAVEAEVMNSAGTAEGHLRDVRISMDDVLAVCKEFEEGIREKDLIKQARVAFHGKTNPMLSKSHCINRVRTWPQGYHGDYKTLETVYRNTPLSDGIGYYLDLHSLNVDLAHAIRARIKWLENMLADELSSRQGASILNIACGSCRELMGVAPEIGISGSRAICVDSDGDALSFAQDRFSYAGVLDRMSFRKYNALRMFDDELNRSEFGSQDIIYSVGLFDYLPTDFLSRMFRSLFGLLNPGGKFIAAFKDARKYRHQDYHWIADWDGFQQRNEEEFRQIIADAGVSVSSVREARDETGIIAFYVMTKE